MRVYLQVLERLVAQSLVLANLLLPSLFVVASDSTLNLLCLEEVWRVEHVVAVQTTHALNKQIIENTLVFWLLKLEEGTLGVFERSFFCFGQAEAAQEFVSN